ncbi:hypothetical protein DPMN_191643 [Dreissena polymorpha]|uniref:Uncharacterized protein n=1 Tax=Dreissena polymorpha TaxID=45954 RepID=A0A9D4BBM3_DREPO|nr:hypothetical protein DPMN_191643 [Dreissena polymorpha]
MVVDIYDDKVVSMEQDDSKDDSKSNTVYVAKPLVLLFHRSPGKQVFVNVREVQLTQNKHIPRSVESDAILCSRSRLGIDYLVAE